MHIYQAKLQGQQLLTVHTTLVLLHFEENTNKMAVTTSLKVHVNNLKETIIQRKIKDNRITQQKHLTVSEPHMDRSS